MRAAACLFGRQSGRPSAPRLSAAMSPAFFQDVEVTYERRVVKSENGSVSPVAAEDTVGVRVTLKPQTGLVTRV